jgi:hypothetical protein
VRAGRPGRDITIKIKAEPWIKFEMSTIHVKDMNFVIPFGMDNAPGRKILDQEVIIDHQPSLVTRQSQIMRARTHAEINDAQDSRLVRPRNVEHHHLACGSGIIPREALGGLSERREEQRVFRFSSNRERGSPQSRVWRRPETSVCLLPPIVKLLSSRDARG